MEDKYKIYDKFVQITMTNIFSLSKANNKIVLEDFSPNDKEHLFIYSVASLAKDVFNKPLVLQGSFWSWAKTNIKLRSGKHGQVKVKRVKGETKTIKVQELIDFERPVFQNALKDENATFADIYKEYYERNFR